MLRSYLVFPKGLAGFFPLHPMTITEAERRRAQAEQTEAAAGPEDAPGEQQKGEKCEN